MMNHRINKDMHNAIRQTLRTKFNSYIIDIISSVLACSVLSQTENCHLTLNQVKKVVFRVNLYNFLIICHNSLTQKSKYCSVQSGRTIWSLHETKER